MVNSGYYEQIGTRARIKLVKVQDRSLPGEPLEPLLEDRRERSSFLWNQTKGGLWSDPLIAATAITAKFSADDLWLARL